MVAAENWDKSTKSNQKNAKTHWLEYHGISQNAFLVDSILIGIKPSMVRYGLFEDEKELFASTFMYSPDSTYYIDMDSYGLEISQGSDGKMEYLGREVDIKVLLVRVIDADSAAIQLMMCGTSCLPEEAYWDNDTTVSILGVSYNDDSDKEFPTIWRYNLITKSFVKFISNNEVKPNFGNYFEDNRLKKILSSPK
ncbi:MAG: hypothetical protein MI892_22630 [Desulfobacterales bacterium]|nr:hypothetical protein [Desulfobacterales bacterium]